VKALSGASGRAIMLATVHAVAVGTRGHGVTESASERRRVMGERYNRCYEELGDTGIVCGLETGHDGPHEAEQDIEIRELVSQLESVTRERDEARDELLASTTIPTVRADVLQRKQRTIDELSRVRDDLRVELAAVTRKLATAVEALARLRRESRIDGFEYMVSDQALAAIRAQEEWCTCGNQYPDEHCPQHGREGT